LKWRAEAARIAEAVGRSRAALLLALAVLIGLSYYERTRALNASYWIDEGISIGVAKHSLVEIPGVLRKDGSPPLYYMLLHVWTDVFGTREVVTHKLSLLCTLLSIPAAYWAASVWGRGAGLAAAVLAAFSPFLDIHAIETRMYALVSLLGFLAMGAFVRGFVYRQRRFVAVFALLLTLMLYSHNWSLFFAIGAGIGILALSLRRRDWALLRDGLLAGAGALVLYAPWIPTLLYQAEHTGAPWSQKPGFDSLAEVPQALLGTDLAIAAVALSAGAGLFLVARRGLPEDRRAAAALALALVVSIALAFGAALMNPAWASRYFAVFLAPLVLLLALGAGRARIVGAIGIAVFAVLSYNPVTPSPYFKSNAEAVANEVNKSLRPRDVVLSTQPEQVPLLRHYLVSDLIWADPLGRVRDPRVTDWRDILDRLRRARPPKSIEPVLRRVKPGRKLVVVRPIIRGRHGWRAPWTRLVRNRSVQIAQLMERDERFKEIDTYRGVTLVRSWRVGVLATVYVRKRDRTGSRTRP
jgi:mannosyltransferase